MPERLKTALFEIRDERLELTRLGTSGLPVAG